jgi:hypothetical protein
MLRVYEDALVGSVPQFPREMEDRIDEYLASAAMPVAEPRSEAGVGGVAFGLTPSQFVLANQQ